MPHTEENSAIVKALRRLRTALSAWTRRREQQRMIAIANELLKLDQKRLEDAGLTRNVLQEALAYPERFQNLDAVKRAAADQQSPCEEAPEKLRSGLQTQRVA